MNVMKISKDTSLNRNIKNWKNFGILDIIYLAEFLYVISNLDHLAVILYSSDTSLFTINMRTANILHDTRV